MVFGNELKRPDDWWNGISKIKKNENKDEEREQEQRSDANDGNGHKFSLGDMPYTVLDLRRGCARERSSFSFFLNILKILY